MTKLHNVAQTFLNELYSNKEMFEMLDSFLESLENKNDPTSEEIQLVSEIYSFYEKSNSLKNRMRRYVNESNENNMAGSKLSELLEEREKEFRSL